MINVSNIFDPSLTLPLIRGENRIFLFPPLIKKPDFLVSPLDKETGFSCFPP
jgi:hypothetical protein